MAIKITEDGAVKYVNENDVDRTLFPNDVLVRLSDLGTAAYKSVANNLTTASAGSAVLDAYQGKVLKDSIDSLNTATATAQQIAEGTVGINRVTRRSGMVYVEYSLTGTSLAGTSGTVATLPEGYRPSVSHYIVGIGTYSGNYGFYTFVINTDGTIKTYTGNSTFSAVYLYGVSFPL